MGFLKKLFAPRMATPVQDEAPPIHAQPLNGGSAGPTIDQFGEELIVEGKRFGRRSSLAEDAENDYNEGRGTIYVQCGRDLRGLQTTDDVARVTARWIANRKRVASGALASLNASKEYVEGTAKGYDEVLERTFSLLETLGRP